MQSGRREKTCSALDQRGCSMVGIGGLGAMSPGGAGPGGIRQEAPDNVHVKLRYQVPEGPDIDLVGFCQRRSSRR